MHFLERGWLSSNNLLLIDSAGASLVDSGFWTHADQTIQLVKTLLQGRQLDTLVNTHLHSDHCGGNSALQVVWPDMHIGVAKSQFADVIEWQTTELSYDVTGQHCPQFKPHFSYSGGETLELSGVSWDVYTAAGHDPHSLLLFQKENRLLITADALWQNGFGVVFPELEGESAFEDVLTTLDLIESLNPSICLPGHGPMFSDVKNALSVARSRCEFFIKNPQKHATYAAKVLIKYRLLELQWWSLNGLQSWASGVPYLKQIRDMYYSKKDFAQMISELIQGLVDSKAAQVEGDFLYNL